MSDRTAALRRFYAALVTTRASCRDKRIEAAYAGVPREAFLGPGPWKVFAWPGYVDTPTDDLAFVYQDVLIGLRPDEGLNNGEPTIHARFLDAVSVQAGDRVLHVGCGSGYYTAILAELAGAGGAVTALEIRDDLAALASAALAGRPNVDVQCRSGLVPPLPESDVIYVNAGVSRPFDCWLQALAPGGRLLLPLMPGWESGCVFLITRRTQGFSARLVCRASFIPCDGGQEPEQAQSLVDAVARDEGRSVRSLRLGEPVDDEACWFKGDGWWLSTREIGV